MRTNQRCWQALLLLLPLAGVATAVLAALIQQTSILNPNSPHPHSRPALPERYMGVNLAGGEFRTEMLPAVHGRDYAYPDGAAASPFLAAGMTAVRLPFRWERLQPTPMAPLDTGELAHLNASLEALRGFKLVILDLHNYANYKGVKLGTGNAPGALLVDFWTRLAKHYRNDSRIAFGLMNEPNGIDGALWRDIAQETLSAIRITGARNLVLVPGSNWTGAHSWTKGGERSNAARMSSLRDPVRNMAFEMHQYLDAHSTGTSDACISPEQVATRLASATEWLREHHARGFLGEFGAPPTSDCLVALETMVSLLDDGRDVWLGWTYWAGGARWNHYPLSIQPDAGGPKPQMQVLMPYLSR
ncbi:glycoside hydrolase family 5 protein [Sphingomonas sp. Ag1]|uniref:glycoside hydrolase family 5 protein n=1 Tax=Sphingomonas sp. Ag1 TaxID=1642949 RepID=UPI000621FABA|nr:glycoside hydrolase family 5 protein [Sphingomonas sp. Ag1]KKI22020.1 hypothetical protein XM50_01290 [Sphingomonas sp. Ag1]